MSKNAKAAQLLKSNINEILVVWEDEVTSEIHASNLAPKLALRDHLPNMLVDIAELIRDHRNVEEISNDDRFEDIIISSSSHGRHRASTTSYTIEQIIKEYIVLHRHITKFLEKHKVFTSEISTILKYTIETAILRSSTSFSESMQEMQEKLIAMLAHDIRNPLSITANCLELMEVGMDEKDFKRLRKVAVRTTKKALDLTEELLDTISVQAGEGIMLTFSQDDYVNEVKTVYQEAIEVYNQEFILDCPYESIAGILDGAALRRVLENLLTNAIKYGDRKKPITISLEDAGNFVKIKVKNEGNPITQGKQKSIFHFLSKNKKGDSQKLHSWGIGLTLVKVVIQAHGGNVEIESTKESGTVFTVTLNKKPGKEGKVRTILNTNIVQES